MIGTAATRQHLGVLLLIMAALLIATADAATGFTVRLGPTAGGEPTEAVNDGETWEVPATPGPIRVEVVAGAAGARSIVVELDGTPVGTYAVVAAGPLEVPVAAGSDDAEEFLTASTANPDRWPAGFSYMTSSDLELGHDPSHASQLVGLRFADLGVPAGARITAADVVFTADGRSNGDLKLTISGERSPAPETFAQDPEGVGTRDLSSRRRTEASVAWSIDEAWTTRTPYATPDLSAIVQEVVDLDGWDAGSGLVLLFEAAEPGSEFRRALSFDGAQGDRDAVPRLRLDYEATLEAPMVTATFDAPPGRSELTITAYGAAGGQGEPVATATVILVRPTDAASTLAPEPEPTTPAQPEPGERVPHEPTQPEPTQPEATQPEPTEPEPTEPETTEHEPTQPEPTEPETTEHEPTEPETTEHETAEPEAIVRPSEPTEPAEPATRPSAVATRVDRWPFRAARTGIVLGEVEATSFDDATSAITLTWRRDRLMTIAGWIHPGTCRAPAPALILLRPLAPHEVASETRVPIPGSALRLGGFVIVIRDEAGAVVSCAELGP